MLRLENVNQKHYQQIPQRINQIWECGGDVDDDDYVSQWMVWFGEWFC